MIGAGIHHIPPQGSMYYKAVYPRQYIAYRAPIVYEPGEGRDVTASEAALAVTIDGDLDKSFWQDVPWSEDFVDIETDTEPQFRTRVKMRWDDNFLYVGAMMEEPDVWATLTEHNSVIFHDNDFEVFVDTEGSNHNYKEFEINAFGTTWSLCLDKPYDDSGGEDSRRVNPDGYDMTPPLKSAVVIYPDNEAINRPDIPTTHWTAEIALPISKLMERNPRAQKPSDGVFWRVNFSRVQWGVKVTDGKYEKSPCCQSCENPGTAAEDNWVWSKQGKVAMHLPERWGIVQFSSQVEDRKVEMKSYEEWDCRCAAMAIYYAQRRYHEKEEQYTDDIGLLKQYATDYFPICEDADMNVVLVDGGFEAKAAIASMTATVNHERLLIVSDSRNISSITRQS